MQKQNFRIRKYSVSNILFSAANIVLAVFGLLTFFPFASNSEASAIIDDEIYSLTVINNQNISLDIVPSDSGIIAVVKDTVVANTNSPAGYKLFVSTNSDTNNIYLNGRRTNDTDDKKIIATDGTAQSPVVLANNTWGYAVAGLDNFDISYTTENPSPASKFAAVPVKDHEQLINDHDGIATDDQTEIYFATKADTNLASGSYETTILYTTLSDATDQNETEINLENATQKIGYADVTITAKTSVMASKPSVMEARVNNISVENITITNELPLEFTFSLPEGLEIGEYDFEFTLVTFAQSFVKQNAIKIEDEVTTMQQMTPNVCDLMALEEQKQLIDTRDNKTYWVAKLKDGNCWMTQNLDYDLSVAANQTLTPETSNVAANRTVVPTAWGTSNDAVYYMDGGDYYYANGATKTAGYSSLPTNSATRHYAAGDYYSWKAATAGIGTTSVINTTVNESICPKGWRLPIVSADDGYGFGNLLKKYGYTGAYQTGTTDAVLLASPLFFVRSGYVRSGSASGQGSNGIYESSSVYSNNNFIYTLDLTGSYINPGSGYGRSDGLAIRCVAQTRSMQDIDTWADDLEEEQQVQARDERDGKKYWVAKLKDGNIWMTQNLDYDLSVAANQTLVPATSNVTTNRTVTPVSWGADYNSVYYLDGGDNYFANGITKTTGLSFLPADSVDRHYAQGDYYSWKAATAGVGTTSITNADVNESICPAGWRLPTSSSNSYGYKIGNLMEQYNIQSTSDAMLLQSPLFFTRSGAVDSGTAYSLGSGGYYWSASAYTDSSHTYGLFFNGTTVQPSRNNYQRYSGLNVRCVAIKKTMQNVSEWKKYLASEQQVQVKDERDGKTYWVAKLKDGNIWMTQNLDYDLSVAENQTLVPATSNVTTTRTVVPVAQGTNSDAIYYMDGGDEYFINGTTETTGLSDIPKNSTDRHYARGDYYSWKAATAGQGTSSISTERDVTESICPKGWRLPTSNSTTANYSFGNLVRQYGFSSLSQNTADTSLLRSPLFITHGGYLRNGVFNSVGEYSNYWTSRSFASNSRAYAWYSNSSYVISNRDYGREYGFNVRCVAL